MLIETAKMTGLRRGELANLKVGDLNLKGSDPVLLVRQGKGGKDRAVSLNPHIRDRLAAFVTSGEAIASFSPPEVAHLFKRKTVNGIKRR